MQASTPQGCVANLLWPSQPRSIGSGYRSSPLKAWDWPRCMAAMAANIAGSTPRGSLPDSMSSRRKSGCLLPAHNKESNGDMF